VSSLPPESSPAVRAAPGSLTIKRRTRSGVARTTRVTVLFADLRGYTALAERLPPAQIVPLLDEFFGVLARATAAHGGTVFHMAGDGMMAGFGGLVPAADEGAREGLVAGHAMLQHFATVAARWRDELSMLAGTGAAALDIVGGGRELYLGPIPVLHLPQFALRGRTAPLDIWCVPALERVAF